MKRKTIFEELREKEEIENSIMHIRRRKYDGQFLVWAPYHNPELATRWQIVSVHSTKKKAETFVRSKKEQKD